MLTNKLQSQKQYKTETQLQWKTNRRNTWPIKCQYSSGALFTMHNGMQQWITFFQITHSIN